jgi:ferrous iron transport protein A
MAVTLSTYRSARLKPWAEQSLGGVIMAGKAMKKQEFSLSELPVGISATISSISTSTFESDAALIQRLVEIGFIPGERVRVIAHGHPGREPIAVRIGGTTFALRRFEADYIYVVQDA